jgi:hypothetical protein
MTPPSSSTGTLRAAQIPSASRTWVNSCQSGSSLMFRIAAGCPDKASPARGNRLVRGSPGGVYASDIPV